MRFGVAVVSWLASMQRYRCSEIDCISLQEKLGMQLPV